MPNFFCTLPFSQPSWNTGRRSLIVVFQCTYPLGSQRLDEIVVRRPSSQINSRQRPKRKAAAAAAACVAPRPRDAFAVVMPPARRKLTEHFGGGKPVDSSRSFSGYASRDRTPARGDAQRRLAGETATVVRSAAAPSVGPPACAGRDESSAAMSAPVEATPAPSRLDGCVAETDSSVAAADDDAGPFAAEDGGTSPGRQGAARRCWPQWTNRDSLCWLDVTLCLLVHCSALQVAAAAAAESSLRALLDGYATAAGVAPQGRRVATGVGMVAVKTGGGTAAAADLAAVREALLSREPSLRSMRGARHSPVFALPVLLAAASGACTASYEWRMRCRRCLHQHRRR